MKVGRTGRLLYQLILLLSISLHFTEYWSAELYRQGRVPIPHINVICFDFASTVYLLISNIVRQGYLLTLNKHQKIIILFFLSLWFSGLYVLHSSDFQIIQFWKTSLHLLTLIFFCVVLSSLLALHMNSVMFLLKIYYLTGIIAAIVGILQFLIANYFHFNGLDFVFFGRKLLIHYGGIRRPFSFFNEPSWYAYYLVEWIGIGYALYMMYPRKKVYLISLTILLSALILTFSLGGFVSFIILMLLISKVNLRKILPIVILFVLISTLISYSGINIKPLQDRVVAVINLKDFSTLKRLDMIKAAFISVKKSPLVGVGTGNLRYYVKDLLTYSDLKEAIEAGKPISTSSSYLKLLGENGIIGLLSFLLMLAYIIGTRSRNMLANIMRNIVILNAIQFLWLSVLFQPRIWFNIALRVSLCTTPQNLDSCESRKQQEERYLSHRKKK